MPTMCNSNGDSVNLISLAVKLALISLQRRYPGILSNPVRAPVCRSDSSDRGEDHQDGRCRSSDAAIDVVSGKNEIDLSGKIKISLTRQRNREPSQT